MRLICCGSSSLGLWIHRMSSRPVVSRFFLQKKQLAKFALLLLFESLSLQEHFTLFWNPVCCLLLFRVWILPKVTTFKGQFRNFNSYTLASKEKFFVNSAEKVSFPFSWKPPSSSAWSRSGAKSRRTRRWRRSGWPRKPRPRRINFFRRRCCPDTSSKKRCVCRNSSSWRIRKM